MKRFVYADREEFAAYEKVLQDGKCHIFEDCELPEGCTPTVARIGFEGVEGCTVFIDKGVRSSLTHEAFNAWLDWGELHFATMAEAANFFGSLRPLLEKKEQEKKEVVDKAELRRLKKAESEPPMVWPEEISERLKKHIFGQDEVLDAIADKIVINRMQREPKLLTLGLIGPTATGKSETARRLAAVMSELYGVDFGFIEVAGNEFLGPHSVHRFFGAPPGYVGHGEPTLLEPVRKKPNHIIVINEIEKADEKLLVGLMEAIDTGKLGMADNSKPVDLSRCIMLFTSNLPIDMETYLALGEFQRAEFCRNAFTRYCGRPEISGKIGSFLVFRPLSEEALTDILVKFTEQTLLDYGLGLEHIEAGLMLDFLRHETSYGARGVRELVSDSLGRHLLRNRALAQLKGKTLSLGGSMDNIAFTVIEKEAQQCIRK